MPRGFKFYITLTDGKTTKHYRVHDDKRPGGLDRMYANAIRQSAQNGDFPVGATINIVSNWRREK